MTIDLTLQCNKSFLANQHRWCLCQVTQTSLDIWCEIKSDQRLVHAPVMKVTICYCLIWWTRIFSCVGKRCIFMWYVVVEILVVFNVVFCCELEVLWQKKRPQTYSLRIFFLLLHLLFLYIYILLHLLLYPSF